MVMNCLEIMVKGGEVKNNIAEIDALGLRHFVDINLFESHCRLCRTSW